MNSLLKKILLKDESVKQFMDLNIRPEDIEENVFLLHQQNRIDISNNHCIVCNKPFIVAVWGHDTGSWENAGAIKIYWQGKEHAAIDIRYLQKNEQENNSIFLYEVMSARNRQVNIFYQFFLLRQFHKKSKNPFKTGKIFSALYAYPRKVIIVSYKENNYYNIFPMDFQASVTDGGYYLLGLRSSNVTLDKILQTRKVVVSDIEGIHTDIVYNLGAHHSNTPPTLESLSFGTVPSEKFGFPVPDICTSYKEIEILAYHVLGSHVLMLGKVINAKNISDTPKCLYHLHLFEYLKSNYENLKAGPSH